MHKEFNVAQRIKELMLGEPVCKGTIIKAHPSFENWLTCSIANRESYTELIQKIQKFVTDICYDWLTNFGEPNYTPKRFPVELSIEISPLYDRDEVLNYVLRSL